MKIEVDADEYIDMLKKKHGDELFERDATIEQLRKTIDILQGKLARQREDRKGSNVL